jgi:alcohol dehydrogenase class IV
MALHHKLCHTLGGSFDLPHAETHAVILPHALAYNAPAIPDVMDALESVLGSDPALALQQLAHAVGAPISLAEIRMPEDGVDRAADMAMSNSYWNPRSLELHAIRDLIMRAFIGAPPLTIEGKSM